MNNFLISYSTRQNSFNLVNIEAPCLEDAIAKVENWRETSNVASAA